jgi:hypothetical protein
MILLLLGEKAGLREVVTPSWNLNCNYYTQLIAANMRDTRIMAEMLASTTEYQSPDHLVLGYEPIWQSTLHSSPNMGGCRVVETLNECGHCLPATLLELFRSEEAIWDHSVIGVAE